MRASDQLRGQLLKEADRMSKLCHYSMAHDLRKCASNVASAQSLLDAAKLVRDPVEYGANK